MINYRETIGFRPIDNNHIVVSELQKRVLQVDDPLFVDVLQESMNYELCVDIGHEIRVHVFVGESQR